MHDWSNLPGTHTRTTESEADLSFYASWSATWALLAALMLLGILVVNRDCLWSLSWPLDEAQSRSLGLFEQIYIIFCRSLLFERELLKLLPGLSIHWMLYHGLSSEHVIQASHHDSLIHRVGHAQQHHTRWKYPGGTEKMQEVAHVSIVYPSSTLTSLPQSTHMYWCWRRSSRRSNYPIARSGQWKALILSLVLECAVCLPSLS